MPPRNPIWKKKSRALLRAKKDFREGEPEGLHDLRVALRRVSATAEALRRQKLAKNSTEVVRRLSRLRQLEVDRHLLGRVRELGLLSADVATGLEARWDALLRSGQREASRAARTQRMHRIEREVKRLTREKADGSLDLLQRERRRAEQELRSLPEPPTDRQLHRYRLAVKKARYLAEDLALAGLPEMSRAVASERKIQDAIGRWNDLRLFRKRLLDTRDEAEKRGAVTLVRELDHLITALQHTVDAARREAEVTARRQTGVATFRRSRRRESEN
jgi:CHAD domain-containing protein